MAYDFVSVVGSGRIRTTERWCHRRHTRESVVSPRFATAGREARPNLIHRMLKKKGKKWVALSESTGREFGTYATKKEAKRRLQQMEIFKHLKKRRK